MIFSFYSKCVYIHFSVPQISQILSYIRHSILPVPLFSMKLPGHFISYPPSSLYSNTKWIMSFLYGNQIFISDISFSTADDTKS